MVECNSIDHNPIERSGIYAGLDAIPLNEISLSDRQHFRLNKINEIKYYFVAEIKEKKLMSKRLSKYIAFCDYFDKSLIVLSATNGSISIGSFATVIGTPVGIASASLSLTFSLFAGIVKKNCKKQLEIKRKSTIKLLMLARSKLNSIESKDFDAELKAVSDRVTKLFHR